MGRMGRPSTNIVPNPDEKRELERITRSHSAENRMILRSKIVLRCDKGMTKISINPDYLQSMDVSPGQTHLLSSKTSPESQPLNIFALPL